MKTRADKDMNRARSGMVFRGCAGAVALLLAGGLGAETPASGDGQDGAAPSVLLRALGDELKRSLAELRFDDAPKPYFLAYRVVENETARASASMGAIVDRYVGRNRSLLVEVRVGSRALDNTNFFSGGPAFQRGFSLPVTDDYAQLRRAIWLATDRTYKAALDDLAGKKAALQNKTQVEEVADFSEEQPFQVEDEQPPAQADMVRIAALATDVSAAFEGATHIFLSTVDVGVRDRTITYLNSEGSSFVRDEPRVSVNVQAETQAEDGTELADFVTAAARAWEQLPSTEALVAQTERMIAALAALRSAPAPSRYTGPVLFEGQAAAELVAQVLAPRFVAAPTPVADNPMFERAMEQMRNPFLDKLGARVMARPFTVVDDPTAVDADGAPYAGSYVVDDDGVPAGPTTLVANGILKTLLTSRAPVLDLPRSSGNRRGSTTPSNLLVNAKNGLDADALRAELIALVEERGGEHGIAVRRIASARMSPSALFASTMGQGPKVLPLTLAYKVFPDGREELIGQAVLPTFAEAQFKDVIATSSARFRHDTIVVAAGGALFAGPIAGGVTDALTTIVTPDLLFEDVTVRRPPGNVPRPPVAAHPLAKKP